MSERRHEDVAVAAETSAFRVVAIMRQLGEIIQECRNGNRLLHGRALVGVENVLAF